MVAITKILVENFRSHGQYKLVLSPTITAIIGINGSGSAFYNGNIRSIRLYGRALTEDEIYQNRQLDIERFNLK